MTTETHIPATIDQTTGEILPLKKGLKFKIKKQITRTRLTLLPELPVYVKIESGYYDLPPEVTIKQAKGQERPIIVNVVDLETGVGHSMMMYTVLKNELDRAYPEQSFVGKSLMIVRHDMRGAKGYCTFDIAELED